MNERINIFIKFLGITVSEFERSCDLSNGSVAKMGENTRTSTIDKISKTYPQLNRSWVRTGEGEMLKENGNTSATPQKSLVKGVPYYDVDFIGGFDMVVNSQAARPDYLIDYEPYNKATCWCNITGHSMEPEISHGDMLALKLVEDTSFIPLGEVYAIVTTNDMRTVKRLGPASSPDAYSLVPTNKSPEYGVQELPKNMIRSIFQVLGCMKKL